MSVLLRAWRTLRDEPWRSAWERAADRRADLRRERSFAPVAAASCAAPAPVLNWAPFPLRRLWGGSALQMIARLEAESAARSIAVVAPQAGGDAWRLEWSEGTRRQLCRLAGPCPQPGVLESARFEDAVLEAAQRAQTSWVHFESAAGLPLRSLSRLRERGLRWMLTVQDFGLISAEPHRVEDPLAAAEPASARYAAAMEVLAAAEAVIFPSPYLRDIHAEIFPGGLAREAIVIPPSVALAASAAPRRGPVRRVAFVGALRPHKGAHLLPEVARRLASGARPIALEIFGAGDAAIARALREAPGVRLHGWYRAGSLPRRLQHEQIDLALLLSTTPESHGLALDECLAAGVPALAFDHGALGERIAAMRCGLTVPLAGGAAAVAAAIAELAASDMPVPVSPELWRVGRPEESARAHLELYRSLAGP